MRAILPDIFTWSWFSEPHGYDFNGYLVVHDEGNLCIDPVVPGDDLSEIERSMKDPSSEMIAAVAGALELTLTDLTVAVAERLRSVRFTASVTAYVHRSAYALAA